MLPHELNSALKNGSNVIVQVRAGEGYHFMIVDGVKTVDGIGYYMIRDPYTGPRGVMQSILDRAMGAEVNSIVIGK